jgi:TonB family protein
MFQKKILALSGSCGLLVFLSILRTISTPLLQSERSEPPDDVSGGAEKLPIKFLKRTFETKPSYTEQARLAAVQGTVVVYTEITKDGSPENLRILRSLGFGLDDEAISAVQQWRFEPDSESGELRRVAMYVACAIPPGSSDVRCPAIRCYRGKRDLSDCRGRNHYAENPLQGGTFLHRRSPNCKSRGHGCPLCGNLKRRHRRKCCGAT